jgi:hypothetical protein
MREREKERLTYTNIRKIGMEKIIKEVSNSYLAYLLNIFWCAPFGYLYSQISF